MKPFTMVKGISVAPVAHYRTSLDKVRTYYGHLMDKQWTTNGQINLAEFNPLISKAFRALINQRLPLTN
jgi:hypothetical protein